MKFLEEKRTIRLTEENEEMINKLVALYPNRFPNMSSLVRASISYFYRQEVDLNGKAKNKDFKY